VIQKENIPRNQQQQTHVFCRLQATSWPPSTTDIAPNRTHFCGSMKHHFKGKHFQEYDEMKAEVHWEV
jgi:hypothetical protein